MMRTVLTIVVYLLTAVKVPAQDRYFLAIQSEDRQPFYVRVSNKTWSSTSVGNLVVPSLGDSTYQVSVGFPRNLYPEQNYLVTFNRKDMGFTLKRSGDQGWALVNWENGEKINPRPAQPVETIWYGEKKKEDAFTNMMAAVVNDSAVLYVASAKSLPGKQEVFANVNAAPASKQDSPGNTIIIDSAVNTTTGSAVDSALAASPAIMDTARTAAAPNAGGGLGDPAIVKTDTAYVKAEPAVTGPGAHADTALSAGTAASSLKDSAQASAAGSPANAGPILVYRAPKPSVSLLKDHILARGRSMVFTDSSAAGVDTISIIIDADPDSIAEPVAEKPAVRQDTAARDGGKAAAPAGTVIGSAPANAGQPGSAPAGAINNAAANAGQAGSTAGDAGSGPTASSAESQPVKKDPAATEDKKKLVLMNSDCSNFATDGDIDKLRVKMMDEPTIDSKLAATRKLFRSKCVYTRQVKALSELFPNDEGKYKFFEHCYPFTADTSEFRSLLSLLSEDAYIARFKALVRIKD